MIAARFWNNICCCLRGIHYWFQYWSRVLSQLKILLSFVAILAASFLPAGADVSINWQGEPPVDPARESINGVLATDRAATSTLQAQRQARRASNRVRDRLNSFGYLDPVIEVEIGADPAYQPSLLIDPGDRFTIARAEVRFADPETLPVNMDELTARAAQLEGQYAEASRVLRVEQALIRGLRAAGYGEAELKDRQVLGDRADASVDIVFDLILGPRLRYGTIEYPDSIRTKTTYLDRLVPFEPGEIYRPDSLAQLNSRLSQTRLFSQSTATLAESGAATGTGGEEVRNIVLDLRERPRNTVGLGASLSTAEGPGLSAELVRRNLTRRGDFLELDLTLATLDRSLEAVWRRPNQFGYGRSLFFSTELSDETTDAFDRQSIAIATGVAFEVSPNLTYTTTTTIEALQETSEDEERDLQLLSFSAGARIDHSNDLLNPTKGWRGEIRVSPNKTIGDADVQYVRLLGQVRYYQPVSDRVVAALRMRAGAVTGAELTDLPSDDRFYAGGGGSVRGFSFQAIGPRTIDGEPLGGRSLIDGSAELRWQRPGKLGYVAFVDVGAVSDSESLEFETARFGAGFGIRYSTPAGPLRFDVAMPLDRTRYDDPVQFYISIGQAF